MSQGTLSPCDSIVLEDNMACVPKVIESNLTSIVEVADTSDLIDEDENEDPTLATPACIDIDDDGEDDMLEECAESELRACTTVVLNSGLNLG